MVDHTQNKEQEAPIPKTIINTRLIWDILLYNFAAYQGTAGTSRSGSLYNRSAPFPEDNTEKGEDIIEMDGFSQPNC